MSGRAWWVLSVFLTSAPYPQSSLDRVADEVRVRSVLREAIALAEQAPVLTDHQVRARLIALAGLARSGCQERGCAGQAPAAHRWAAGTR